MDIGSYSAASAGLLNLRRLDVVNNNLANTNTPGFKGQYLISRQREFQQTLAARIATDDPFAAGDHERTPAAIHVGTATDFTQGPVHYTGNPLDVALQGDNTFFAVQGLDGEEVYTRAGNFTLNEQGQLVTQDGRQVLGDGGPIQVQGGSATISPGGAVLVDGQPAGRLKVVQIQDTSGIDRVGGNAFRYRGEDNAPQLLDVVTLEPASLEKSNVSAISSMIDLIAANRAFEAYTKVSRSLDEMNQTAISRLGSRT